MSTLSSPSTQVASTSSVQSSFANQAIKNNPLPRPICWHEGMLLSPHHFQQNHQYWEGQLSRILSTLASDYWGVGELVLDQADLLDGMVNIHRLFAILPDGLVVDYRSTDDDVLQADIADVDSTPTTVYLTVPIQVDGSASERSEIQRYFSRDDKPRKDENTGDNEIIMPRLVPKLSLQVTDRVGDRYISLPLFQVVKPEGGSLEIAPDYCPPLLSISADKFRLGNEEVSAAKPIQQQAQALAFSIRHKAMQLAGIAEDGEDLGRNISQRHHRYIRSMVQELPALELIADSNNSLPRDLYERLIRMAGSISEMAKSIIPPRFSAYSHIDNYPNFKQVITYIKQHVDSVNLSYSTISFDVEREGMYTLHIDKEWAEKDLVVELKTPANMSSDDISQWFKTCRIASIQLHKDLSKRRLLGAKAELITSEGTSGISAAPGNVLFKIKADKNLIHTDKKLLIVSTSNKVKEYVPQSILLHMPHA